MGERVIPLDSDPFRAPSLDRKHESIVAASVSIITHNDVGIVLTDCRILQIENAPLVGVCDRRTFGAARRSCECDAIRQSAGICAVGDVHGRIGFVPVQHMNNVVADIVSGNEPIRPELMLNTEIPLVEVWLFQVEGEYRVNASQGERAVLIESNRERISTGLARPWIIERRAVYHNAGALRRRVTFPPILVQVREIEKDSVSRPNDGHAIAFGIPRQSDARRKSFPIVRLPRIGIGKSAFSLEVNSSRRVRINGAHDTLIKSRFVEKSAFTRSIVW